MPWRAGNAEDRGRSVPQSERVRVADPAGRRSLFGWVSPLLTLALAAFVVVSLTTADPVDRDRAERIGKQVRCPACEGESIAESPSSYAADMMGYVREMIGEGRSDQQILDRLMAAYPRSQMLDPPFQTRTALLWALPAAVLVTGLFLAFFRLRKPVPPESTGEAP
ncbi:MAG: cytochrome c-type biogenesis protein CcmH [Acidimicrobiia bacterium]|nr:cytochrome c-type biogenesis protein CcmH [Acidimicrobiia bacterium]MXX45782.1 cytochrome c-type biogenesis protein CcmH [Acidimicrobiia bacterium]MXY74043.1 cytochrome c-type biogenesis protein CcmH [Acidimicrobiia bacterium]MYA39653.1 cytochrome c-type biogenesis protein CcmH [Acidimicrobiia bacterium]MYB77884.1 cytochrome c-type biogenesis protein CcmH [Acidimicrobiia bacterium]